MNTGETINMIKKMSIFLSALFVVLTLGACASGNQKSATGTAAKVAQSTSRVSEQSKAKSSSPVASQSSQTSQASSSTASATTVVAKEPTRGRQVQLNGAMFGLVAIPTAQTTNGSQLPSLYTLADGPHFESKDASKWIYANTQTMAGQRLASRLAVGTVLTVDGKSLRVIKQYTATPEQVKSNHDIMDEYYQWNSHWFIETPNQLFVLQE
jgi:hypothetical protein